MPRYFIEVAYIGTNYSGFQVQQNANTIQAEIQRALKIFYKKDLELTGSSRTDAGVHAIQNYFHFDFDEQIIQENLYHLNALLSHDIVIKNIFQVKPGAHCRFDAMARTYYYYIHRSKNPFLQSTSYYYPFKTNTDLLFQYASIIPRVTDFTSFSKRKTQVNHFICNVQHSCWKINGDVWRYEIKADRFLRGMVKALVGTMLTLAKKNADITEFEKIIYFKDAAKANFSPPSRGLFLKNVELKPEVFLIG